MNRLFVYLTLIQYLEGAVVIKVCAAIVSLFSVSCIQDRGVPEKYLQGCWVRDSIGCCKEKLNFISEDSIVYSSYEEGRLSSNSPYREDQRTCEYSEDISISYILNNIKRDSVYLKNGNVTVYGRKKASGGFCYTASPAYHFSDSNVSNEFKYFLSGNTLKIYGNIYNKMNQHTYMVFENHENTGEKIFKPCE